MPGLNPATSILLVSPLVALSVFSTAQVTLAQTHFGHHHIVLGVDSLETLTNGTYAGLSNPNYNRLSLVFPHPHEPPERSHFHAIGIYSYTGAFDNPLIIPTSTNNQLPEYSYNLPPLPLVPGKGVFKNQMVNLKIDENIYSDLTTKPVAHLTEDLSDPYIAAIYNTGNSRWNRLLGDKAVIGLELVSITPGLTFANSNRQTLLDSVGDQIIIGQGDDWEFKPYVYAPQRSQTQDYSATLKFFDLNLNEEERWLESGEFTINFQAAGVPEPLTIVGAATALGFGTYFKRKLSKK